MSVPINSAVFIQSSTRCARHRCKRPMQVLRPGSCLVKAQPQRQPYIQLRIVRKLEEANVRRAAPDLFFRGEKSVVIEVVYFVKDGDVSCRELLVEEQAARTAGACPTTGAAHAGNIPL